MDASFWNYSLFGNSVRAYLLFLGIIILCLAFKRLFSRLFSHFLLQFFGRFGKEVNATVFVGLLVKPVELFISLLLIYLAIHQLNYPLHEVLFKHNIIIGGKETTDDTTLLQALDRLFQFLILVSLSWMVLRIIDFVAHVLVYRATQQDQKDRPVMVQFVRELIKIAVVMITFFATLGWVFEINVVQLIAGLGIGGIAIALAAKESLENLLGYFTIFVDKPFVVGNLVKVNSIEGTVEHVGFRSTRVRTADKTLVTMPNKTMIDTSLENLSLREYRRVVFEIPLALSTTTTVINKVTEAITATVNAHPKTGETTTAFFESFGDAAINLKVIYFVEMMDYYAYLKVREAINLGIIDIINAHPAKFAYPVRVLHHLPPKTEDNEKPKDEKDKG